MHLTLLNILIRTPLQSSIKHIFTIVSRTATFTVSCFYRSICCPTFSCFYHFQNNWNRQSYAEAVIQYSCYTAVVKILDK